MSTDEEAVLAAEATRYAAMIAGDVRALEGLLDDDLVYSHSDGSRDSRETYLKKVSDRHFVYQRIDAPVERLLIIGDCAVLTGTMNAEVSVGGQSRGLNNGCLAVYRRTNGQWTLMAYQPTPLR
jgi:ketosteroid isomerase-like protein